jgi:hypothetical protein
VANRGSDLEMHAVFDPRITLLKELRGGEWPVPIARQKREPNPETVRREAEWPTWQMDRSWPEGSATRMSIEHTPVSEAPRTGLAWVLGAAGFLALGIVVAGLLAVGIEKGLL